jgi:ParB/RepB/Spo0J family partition protein
MSTPTLTTVPTKQIAPSPDNPRGEIDRHGDEFAGLCVSIKAVGLLQPILVSAPNGDGKYTILDGHRRHAAALEEKVEDIPVMVLADGVSEKVARLAANIQREDFSVVAQARAIKDLQDDGLTQVQAGDLLGKSERWVRERLRILRLPEKTQAAYDARSLPVESLVTVEKIAKQAPKVAEAVADASAEQEDVRKAIGADNVAFVLDCLVEQSAEDLQKDGTSKLGCLVRVAGDRMRGQVTYEALVVAGPPHDRLKAVKDALAESKKLIAALKKVDGYGYHRHPDPMWFDVEDCDAAKVFGCLLEIGDAAYVTDASWLADRFLLFVQGQNDEIRKKTEAKKKDKSASRKATQGEKGTPEEEKAAKEERRRQREDEQQRKDEIRAANLELGQRTERALRSPKLSLEEAKLFALMAVGNHSEGLGARGLIYCYHDYQQEEQLKNGRRKVTYETGRVAGEDLVKAILGAKKPEDALGVALRAMVLATFADQDCVVPSSQSYFSLEHHAKDQVGELLQVIAGKRQVLPDAIRKRIEEERQAEAEEAEMSVLEEAKRSRAKTGVTRANLLRYHLVTPHVIDGAVDAKHLKQHGEDNKASYTITAAGKKRFEKLKAEKGRREAE